MGQRCGFLERSGDGNVKPTAWYHRLVDSLCKHDWRTIIIDPWARWGGPEAETDAHAATIGVSLLETLTKLPGNPAVIVAHHTRKPSQGTKSQDANDTRGSSALVDGARWVCNMVKRANSPLIDLCVTKANYTVPGDKLVLTRAEGGTLRPATPMDIEAANV